jgi:hypothetical protein
MKIGSVFEQTSTTEFVAMLDQQYDNERLLFSYVELSPNGLQPNSQGERIIARIKNLCKENPLLSRDQAGISASVDIGGLGFDFSRRFTYGWAECSVIGALINGRLDMNRRVIAPNAEVYTPSSQTLRQLFFNPSPAYIPLGNIETFGSPDEQGVPVTLNADQMVTKHFRVFGMTGSGKTNTSAKLLEELMARGHRMIIFDSHDDYKNLENFANLFSNGNDTGNNGNSLCRVNNRNCDAVQLAVNRLNSLSPNDLDNQPLVPNKPINEWVCERLIRTASVIHENEPARKILEQGCRRVTPELVNTFLNSDPWVDLIRSPQVLSKSAFPELKFYGQGFEDFTIILLQSFQGEVYSSAQWRWLRTNINQAGQGVDYLKNLWRASNNDRNLKDGNGRINSTGSVLQQSFNGLQAIYNDALQTGAQPLDFEAFFRSVSDRNTCSTESVHRLSLTDLSSNLRKALVYGVVTYFFRSFKFGGYRATSRGDQPANAHPVIFVLEEARSLIPKSSGSDEIDVAGAQARKAMREIAYEGRKFSLGFGLISQKPSTVDPEVVSQSNTFILHQLKSPDDQEYVRSVTESMSRDELEMIKSLGTGRAIVAGVAIQSPVLLQVYPRYSQEGIQEPTPIADALNSVQQIRQQLNIGQGT